MELLAEAIATAANKAGIYNGTVPLSGPHLVMLCDDMAREIVRLSARQPVAWRVKDFADGWILFHNEAEARREAYGAGNLVEPLYALSTLPNTQGKA